MTCMQVAVSDICWPVSTRTLVATLAGSLRKIVEDNLVFDEHSTHTQCTCATAFIAVSIKVKYEDLNNRGFLLLQSDLTKMGSSDDGKGFITK